MFRTAATVREERRPLHTDWTTRELLDWLADDDVRCHDDALVPLLSALDRELDGLLAEHPRPASLAPRSPVALVRALASRVRMEPGLGDVRVRDLTGPVIAPDAPTPARRPAPAAASVSAPAIGLG
ncbi:hypothetical protein ACFT30_02765 [Microbacterium ureisolvens]|uniref:hypothetical protein n=1 Tax=Microbacterium ureisolvens TaxID=2781186 RepID=UPI00362DCFA4